MLYYINMGIKGYEKLSLVDYDLKLSATIFFGGCNFRCPFCHNSSLVLNPNSVKDIPFCEIIEHLKKRRGIIDAVTFTGGEPTLFKELKAYIKQVKELGFLIKLDTNGSNPSVIKNLLDENLLDYIAMDIKNSLTKYPFTCGVQINIENIIKSIEIIMNSNIDYEFRTTLIKEHHLEEDIYDISNLLKGAKKMRLQKYIPSENCIDASLNEVRKEDALKYVSILKKTISDVSLRGY